MTAPIRRALLSVSDKTGLLEFAQTLAAQGVQILSTGGTAKLLTDNGIACTEVADYTGAQEMLDGRVKTLHPIIHGGILAQRDNLAHQQTLTERGIGWIDLVVVNLYPFAQTVAKPDVSFLDAIENIDIGGPAMLRSSAKNHADVTVICDPLDYAKVAQEMAQHGGATSLATRFALAKKVFAHTASYDGMIANYLSRIDDDNASRKPNHEFGASLSLQFAKAQDCRYGENPHQSAAFYRQAHAASDSFSRFTQLHGKELSYNNLADGDAAWEAVKQFTAPACVIVKHANPCGVALGSDALSAYEKAFATDKTSAFGGILAFNVPLDLSAAQAIMKQFAEVIIAPSYSPEALALLQTKANQRLLICSLSNATNAQIRYELKQIGGGVLVQSADAAIYSAANIEVLQVVSRVKPSAAQLADLDFAWRVAKMVKSNAIIFCGGGQTLGIGAGQMSRIDSTEIAGIKAANAQLNLSGSVVASDAFFPFRDGIDALAKLGAKAVIHPGGSVRDDEVIAAADEHGLAMVLTGMRHFKH